MASIKQSLKNVYKALSGGTDSNAKTIPDIINDISTVAGSGGGGGVFIVEATYYESYGTKKFRMSEKNGDIYDNYIAGVPVVIDFSSYGEREFTRANLVYATKFTDNHGYVFVVPFYTDRGDVKYMKFGGMPDESDGQAMMPL